MSATVVARRPKRRKPLDFFSFLAFSLLRNLSAAGAPNATKSRHVTATRIVLVRRSVLSSATTASTRRDSSRPRSSRSAASDGASSDSSAALRYDRERRFERDFFGFSSADIVDLVLRVASWSFAIDRSIFDFQPRKYD